MTKRKKIEVPRLILISYMAMIKNSVGSKMFRNFYGKINGKKKDLMKNGGLSCAFYVSSLLTLFNLVDGIHGTVDQTVHYLRKSGWKTINKPKIGCIIVWDEIYYENNESHKHIGFYIGKNTTVSNSHKHGYPIRHHWRFNGKRKVKLIMWHPKLND